MHAHGFLQAFDGFNVVVIDVGFRIEHRVDLVETTLEIGHEHLDRGVGIAVTHSPNGGRPDGGAAVREFIPGHRRDDTVLEVHLGDGVGNTGGFGHIILGGTTSLDRTEIT